jgi:hypothetical protein
MNGWRDGEMEGWVDGWMDGGRLNSITSFALNMCYSFPAIAQFIPLSGKLSPHEISSTLQRIKHLLQRTSSS